MSNIGFGQSDPIEYAGSDGTQQLDIGPTRDTTDGNDAQRLAFTFDTDSADDDGTSYYNLLDDSPTPNLNLNYI